MAIKSKAREGSRLKVLSDTSAVVRDGGVAFPATAVVPRLTRVSLLSTPLAPLQMPTLTSENNEVYHRGRASRARRGL